MLGGSSVPFHSTGIYLTAGGFLRGFVLFLSLGAHGDPGREWDVLRSSWQSEAFPYIYSFPDGNYPLLLGHQQQQTFFLITKERGAEGAVNLTVTHFKFPCL